MHSMSKLTESRRASGHGTAAGEWLTERITALLLIPLTPWLALSLAALPGVSHAAFVDWIREPLHYLPLLVFLLVSAWHARLGLESVAIDYVQGTLLRRLVLATIKLTLLGVLLAAAAAIFLLNQQG